MGFLLKWIRASLYSYYSYIEEPPLYQICYRTVSKNCSTIIAMSVERINAPEISDLSHTSSHATKVPGLIFLSGQTPMDGRGVLVDGGIQKHTAQCIENLGNVLKAAGSSWDKVVKINVYLKDMGDFEEMNEVYEKLLPNPKPAGTCIQAGRLVNDVDVEIEAIAAY